MSAKIAAAMLGLLLAACATPAERAPLAAPASGAARLAACAGDSGWDTPGPPAKIHGNSYYVGTCGIASILILGDKGHVLIDSGTDKGAEVVLANIRALGIDPRDVKILLTSHEHVDHVAGIAALQRATGAKLYASPLASKVLETGVASPLDPQAGLFDPFTPARVDRRIAIDEVVRLGGLAIETIFTPGHTYGATSWRWRACDGDDCRTLVYADSLNPISKDGYRFSDHPDLVRAFRAGIARIADSPCDILLTPHPGGSNLDARMAGNAPLVDAGACRAYAAGVTARLDARLAKEKDGR